MAESLSKSAAVIKKGNIRKKKNRLIYFVLFVFSLDFFVIYLIIVRFQSWICVWRCHTATPAYHLAFSPDGTLFATSGKNDRLVKIWYQNKGDLFSFN